MKLKIIIVFMAMLSICLCGCTKENEEQKLIIYNLQIDFYNEYTVRDLDNIYVYFPVITNKKITATKLGDVGAKYNLKSINKKSNIMKVNLIAENQDKINIMYDKYYISFLKYKVEITGIEISDYNSIELNDTKLWVLCNEEILPVNFIDNYLKIFITQNVDILYNPDWNEQVLIMLSDIKLRLNER